MRSFGSDTQIQSSSAATAASLSPLRRVRVVRMQRGDSRPFKRDQPLSHWSRYNGAHFCQQREGLESPDIYSMERLTVANPFSILLSTLPFPPLFHFFTYIFFFLLITYLQDADLKP